MRKLGSESFSGVPNVKRHTCGEQHYLRDRQKYMCKQETTENHLLGLKHRTAAVKTACHLPCFPLHVSINPLVTNS